MCVCVCVRTAGRGVLTWVCVTDLPRTSQPWSGLFRLAASCQRWMLDERCLRGWAACQSLEPRAVLTDTSGCPRVHVWNWRLRAGGVCPILAFCRIGSKVAQLPPASPVRLNKPLESLKACMVCLHGGLFISALPATLTTMYFCFSGLSLFHPTALQDSWNFLF